MLGNTPVIKSSKGPIFRFAHCSIRRKNNFLSSNRSIWVSKKAEFYAYSKSEDEIEKKCTDKKLFKKN